MPTYAQLTTKHPEYDADYWAKIRTLYSGMSRMRLALKDKKLRQSIFPQHLGEEEWVYEERIKRAYCIPYMGNLIDTMVSSLFGDPVRMNEEAEADAQGEKKDPTAPVIESESVNGDPFYDEFYKDCSHPGGPRQDFNQLLKALVTEALLCRRSWALCDMPSTEGEQGLPDNRLEEEAEVADAAWAVPLCPEQVYDWELDEDGELMWALVAVCSRRRKSLEQGRNIVREEFTYYTADAWERYVYEYDPDKNPPKPEQPPDSMSAGPHSYGRVPLCYMELPDGLWAGGKLESIAAEHFNKENALAWGSLRSLFQFLAVRLSPPDALNPITEDPNRDVNQVIGPGRIFRLGEKDDVGYVSPDSAPFAFAREALDRLRDEMHRVLSQMANSIDNSGAALKRSADSKAVDAAQSAIILKELGRRVRELAEHIYEMVASGRGEDKQFVAQGMDSFDEVSLDSLITEAATLETVPIPSQTFKALYKFGLARRALPGATEEQLTAIQEELKNNITAEAEMAEATLNAQGERIQQGVLPGESPPPEEGAPPKRAKKPSKKVK
jgi:hypothetical protein